MPTDSLASYQHCVDRIRTQWPAFLAKRRDRLAQQERHEGAAEKVAEDIIADLFTDVLDWTLRDLNHQVGFADVLLSRLGVKYLLLETKRPSALTWSSAAVRAALAQACRYAAEQRVSVVAISDGTLFYAADVQSGGLADRVCVRLDVADAPLSLWWLSVHGIYRDRPDRAEAALRMPAAPSGDASASKERDPAPCLHHKYHLPADCFAYVGNAAEPNTWHLPFRCIDGSVDRARLPKAIQSIITNYRGAKVSSVPEAAIPAVLRRLSNAASEIGRMPNQCPETSPVYKRLAEVLEQLDGGLPNCGLPS